MLKLQEVSQGVNLVGKNVEYMNPSSGEVSRGRVSEITMSNGKLAAVVGNSLVDINLIKSISV
jgi:ribosomal protein L35AE/L33A